MKKKLIIGIAILLLLGIVGAWYFLRTPETETTEQPGTFPTVGGPAGPQGTGVAPEFFDDPLDASGRPVEAAPRLVKITNGPVATGLAALASTTGSMSDTSVRYVERASGNLFEYHAQERSITRRTNQTIPGVVEASWLSDGSRTYLRYLSEAADTGRHIETYTLPLSGEGQLLARDLQQVTGDGSSSVITVASGINGTIAYRAGLGGVGGSPIFSTPIRKLFVFPTQGGMFAQTPASSAADNYLFSIDPDGSLSRIPAPTRGTTMLPSPDGKLLLVSSVSDGAIVMDAIIVATRETIRLPLGTFSEKCAWTPDSTRVYCGVPAGSPSGTLPDDWYQGVLGLQDQIWTVDFSDRVALFVANLPSLTEAAIDIVSPTIDASEKMLFFINRNDGSLWAYEL